MTQAGRVTAAAKHSTGAHLKQSGDNSSLKKKNRFQPVIRSRVTMILPNVMCLCQRHEAYKTLVLVPHVSAAKQA